MFAWAHAEHGLGMHVYTPAQRDAPTNMINNALAVGAAHKLRFAQDLILYNLELVRGDRRLRRLRPPGGLAGGPDLAAVREIVEQLTGIRDWAEAFFATAVVFEPLVGELFRSGFVMQVAALQGDFVTPTIMGAGESDAAREQRGARALFGMLANDEQHGEENRADDAGLAGRPRRRAASPRRASCSRSGRSSPRRPSATRTPSTARRALRRACCPTSDSRPRRRSTP